MAEINPFNSHEFRKELAELLDEKLKPMSDLVLEHERALQRGKGAMWLLGVLWTVVVAGAEWLFHRH
jgi:hypothetical protein